MKKTRDKKKAPYQKPKIKSDKKLKDLAVHCPMMAPKVCAYPFSP
jgi:hypothetical protein